MEWNEKRIAEAAKDFNKWQGKAVVMVDTSDGDVWTDIFISGNEVKRYNSDSIKPLHIYTRMIFTVGIRKHPPLR